MNILILQWRNELKPRVDNFIVTDDKGKLYKSKIVKIEYWIACSNTSSNISQTGNLWINKLIDLKTDRHTDSQTHRLTDS